MESHLDICLSAIFLFNLSGKGDVPKKRTYICGLGARIECEPLSEHSTHSDRVTDIGSLLSFGPGFVC